MPSKAITKSPSILSKETIGPYRHIQLHADKGSSRWTGVPSDSVVATPTKHILGMVLDLLCFLTRRKSQGKPPSPPTKEAHPPTKPEASTLDPQSRLSTTPEAPLPTSTKDDHPRPKQTYTSFPAPVFHHGGQPRALDSRTYPDIFPPAHNPRLPPSLNPPPSHPCYSTPFLPPHLSRRPSPPTRRPPAPR